MDNYERSRLRAEAYFLNFDQAEIIRRWDLRHNEDFLYVDFLGRTYAICRRTGGVTRLWDQQEAGFEEALSIFDLLCHEGDHKHTAGTFAPVNSLKGRPVTAGVETSFHSKTAARFDSDPDAFVRACLALGGKPVEMGDMGFQFPVFGPLSVILKFYHSDEDFPAALTCLWDANTLQFLFYETVFYAAGFLLSAIVDQMQK